MATTVVPQLRDKKLFQVVWAEAGATFQRGHPCFVCDGEPCVPSVDCRNVLRRKKIQKKRNDKLVPATIGW